MFTPRVFQDFEVDQILTHLQIKHRKNGDEFVCNCPWHEDKNPSFGVSISKGAFNCLSCGQSGTIVQLCGLFGETPNKILGSKSESSTNFSRSRLAYMGASRSKPNIEVFGYTPSWRKNENCYNYVTKKRGIAPEVADKLGFKYSSSATVNGLLLQERLLIDCYDEDGSLSTIEARDITGKSDKKVIYPTNSSSDILFNFNNIQTNKPLYIVEGIMDLTKVLEHESNVVSTFGCLLKKHQKALLDRDAKTLVFIPDNDTPALIQLHKFYRSFDKEFYVLPVPEQYKDVGDMDSMTIKTWLSSTNYIGVKKYLDIKLGGGSQ